MKSISLKVTIWSVAALAISLAVFLLIGANVIGKSTTENFTHVNQQLFRYALTVYHADGKEGLARYMQELNQPETPITVFAMLPGTILKAGRTILS